jgi:hypothetical protein
MAAPSGVLFKASAKFFDLGWIKLLGIEWQGKKERFG